jgi:peptidoglycan L-alanyl-D-glutamate endopeptidase CwlK
VNTGHEKMDLRSNVRLQGVHPRLQDVIRRAGKMAAGVNRHFIVTEGLRSTKRQAELVRAGASLTMNSKHLVGRAVDLAVVVGKEVRWDWPLYLNLAEIVKAAAQAEGVAIVWGGDWKTFRDGPHFELAASVK